MKVFVSISVQQDLSEAPCIKFAVGMYFSEITSLHAGLEKSTLSESFFFQKSQSIAFTAFSAEHLKTPKQVTDIAWFVAILTQLFLSFSSSYIDRKSLRDANGDRFLCFIKLEG